jgi:hypothetical protein
LLWSAATAEAQSPIAVNDSYQPPAGGSLVVEPIGVLENDTDALGEDLLPTAVAELVADVGNGILALAADGSFIYTPDPGFLGVDSFSYRVVEGTLFSNVATVSLDVSGCAGTLPLLTCWVESEYVARLQALGYSTYAESFEEASVWPLSPIVSPSVTSLGITWSSNHAPSDLTTGSGPARTGARGVYSLPHGNNSGALFDPQRDGFTGTAAGTLVGVGGWLDSNTGGARVQFVLTPLSSPRVVVDFAESAVTSQHRFFGVIDTRGFATFEIVETEGVVEDQEFIFGDDFTFAVVNAPTCGDGVDNDGDGFADFPIDPGCLHAIDGIENPQCQDGVNNDPGQDGLIDFDGGASAGLSAGFQTAPDPQCQGDAWRDREANRRRCGLGFELALILPGLMWLRRRRALR